MAGVWCKIGFRLALAELRKLGEGVDEKWRMCTQGKPIEIRESIRYNDISS